MKGGSSRLGAMYRAVPLALSALVFWPIVLNYFFTDDFPNMYIIANDGVLEFLLTPWGGHSLIFRSAIFWLSYQLFGFDPHFYYLCAFLTHLVNVYLTFELVRRLTGSAGLACFGATLWGIAADNEGSIGFYSVYGQELVAMFLLWLLNDLLRHPGTESRISARRLISWYVVMLLAATSYGNGLPVAVISPLVVYLMLPKSPERTRTVTILSSLILVVPALYLVLLQLYKWVTLTPWIAVERLGDRLDQWPLMVSMLEGLLRHGASRLLLPFLCASNEPRSWLCLAVPWVLGAGVVWALLRAPDEARRRLLALVVIVVATYAAIAAARGPIMSIFRQTTDWGAMQPRYHYLGQLGIAIIVCLLFAELVRIPRYQVARQPALLAGWIAVILAFHFVGGRPINHHDSSRREVESVLKAVDAAVAGTPEGGTAYVQNRPFVSRGWVGGNAASFPGWAAIFVIAYPDNLVAGRRVVFVERDPDVLARARVGLNRPIAKLLSAWGDPIRAPSGKARRAKPLKPLKGFYLPAPSPSMLQTPDQPS